MDKKPASKLTGEEGQGGSVRDEEEGSGNEYLIEYARTRMEVRRHDDQS